MKRKIEETEEQSSSSSTTATTIEQEAEQQQKPVSKRKQHQLAKKLPGFSRFPKRVRAHCNPLADEYYEHPIRPEDVDWKAMYPNWDSNTDKVNILDVGCAFGGLICSIAPVKPDYKILGIEIRSKVVEFTQDRITKLRNKDDNIEAFIPVSNVEEVSVAQKLNKRDPNHDYNNVWAIRSNAMKYLPCYFKKGQLDKIFFMFPDPHFKKKNHRRRIISPTLVSEYGYILKPGGMIYTITDVKDLGDWMKKHLDEHPLYELVSEEDLKDDPLIPYIQSASEDGQRTTDEHKDKYLAVFRKKVSVHAPPQQQ
jgi:tRNA (guanine-N7-)-methyltransferase